MNTEYKNDQYADATQKIATGFVSAIRLMSNLDGSCTFEKGKIPTLAHIGVNVFWVSNQTEEWEKNIHVAPRKQYVITIQGTVRFKVTGGSTFVIEPGIILLAEDTEGEGHSWDIVNGTEWVRLYIPMVDNADDLFIPDDGMF